MDGITKPSRQWRLRASLWLNRGTDGMGSGSAVSTTEAGKSWCRGETDEGGEDMLRFLAAATSDCNQLFEKNRQIKEKL